MLFACRKPLGIYKILLEIISLYSKVAGYKVNIQNLIAFPYASNEQLDSEIKETLSFTIKPKKESINLTKYAWDLCTENYKYS